MAHHASAALEQFPGVGQPCAIFQEEQAYPAGVYRQREYGIADPLPRPESYGKRIVVIVDQHHRSRQAGKQPGHGDPYLRSNLRREFVDEAVKLLLWCGGFHAALPIVVPDGNMLRTRADDAC